MQAEWDSSIQSKFFLSKVECYLSYVYPHEFFKSNMSHDYRALRSSSLSPRQISSPWTFNAWVFITHHRKSCQSINYASAAARFIIKFRQARDAGRVGGRICKTLARALNFQTTHRQTGAWAKQHINSIWHVDQQQRRAPNQSPNNAGVPLEISHAPPVLCGRVQPAPSALLCDTALKHTAGQFTPAGRTYGAPIIIR